MNMNDLEIYDSITYMEPFSLPAVQNRKRDVAI